MKLTYIADTRMPTEMAHGLQIMKMCEAFAKQGIDLELVIPMRFRISKIGAKNPFDYYKVDKIFKIKKIFCFDLTPLNRFLGPISFGIQAISFSFFVFLYILFKKRCLIYGRDRFGLFFISFFKKFIYEVHKTHRFLFKGIIKRADKLVAITKGIKTALIESGISENKILEASDGIDLEDFDIKEEKDECRKKLNLPPDKKLILYAGQLYKWKGVETLALASKYLASSPQSLIPNHQSLISSPLIVIVGGIKWYFTEFENFVRKNNLKNVLLLGQRDYSKIPYFLKSADCLVLTGTRKSLVSEKYTSPMKMFEYMASGVPIVASDLSSFREVLYDDRGYTQIESRQVENTQIHADNQRESVNVGNQRPSAYPKGDNQRVSASTDNQRISASNANAILVEPDNPEAMAEGIKKALTEKEFSAKISEQAYRDVQRYTWDNRAKSILNFILSE